jgi:hypothetical protein
MTVQMEESNMSNPYGWVNRKGAIDVAVKWVRTQGISVEEACEFLIHDNGYYRAKGKKNYINPAALPALIKDVKEKLEIQ